MLPCVTNARRSLATAQVYVVHDEWHEASNGCNKVNHVEEAAEVRATMEKQAQRSRLDKG